ncbi:cytochrome P450 [Pseudonocardia alaniniphila]|uniref:Cytochrome P450 n=1 Tax=Pseudonocardia alaniniphila TaxID=75291 RepID=A0ABS9TTA5_9PSEU|nr:cytochrome P450 [Pseudonocardia alaniniphila]MCH6171794.1 cytochrome P450 [Pseudonocardia alaniniphila]
MSAVAGCPVAHGFDPLSDEYLAEPYSILNDLRESGPVHYVPSIDYWVVTRYEDIAAILSDPVTYSATVAQAPLSALTDEAQDILRLGLRNVPVLSNLDPPAHSRIRLHLAPLFLPRKVAKLQQRIEEFSKRLIDDFAQLGRVDIVPALTFPLPALTVFRLLGFPDADGEQLKQWCGDKLEINWGRPDAGYQLRAATNMVKFWDYCERFVEQQTQAPGDNLTSQLIRQRESDDSALNDREIASVIFALSFAGHETTTNLIGNALRNLLSHPGLWQRLHADPTLVDSAVEETLRFDSSVIAWRRVTTRAVTIGNVDIPANTRLMLAFGAANHDPSVFPEPEVFDINRENARVQLSFGKGTHFCLGQHLGRVEVRTVIGMLARRFPDLRLAEGQTVTYPRNISFRGPESLIVEWSPQEAAQWA